MKSILKPRLNKYRLLHLEFMGFRETTISHTVIICDNLKLIIFKFHHNHMSFNKVGGMFDVNYHHLNVVLSSAVLVIISLHTPFSFTLPKVSATFHS